jgi:hypothetical protein
MSSCWNTCPICSKDMEEIYENSDGDAVLTYHFDTAYSPPVPVILRMSRKFPTLTFALNYFEMGMAFCGMVVLKNEEVIVNEVNNNYHGGRGG